MTYVCLLAPRHEARREDGAAARKAADEREIIHLECILLDADEAEADDDEMAASRRRINPITSPFTPISQLLLYVKSIFVHRNIKIQKVSYNFTCLIGSEKS